MLKVKIYIMNPEKFQNRRSVLKDKLNNTKFKYEFMSINDEVELTHDAIVKNHDSKKTKDSFGRNFSRGELASTLNHLLAYKKFIESENDIAIILEDDVTFDNEIFERITNIVTKTIDVSRPQVCLLTPVISYLKYSSITIDSKYKIASVVQAWGQAYVINRLAAKSAIKTNNKSWIIADDWVRYNRYAGISLLGVIPSIVKINEIFNSNLMSDRSKSTRNNKTFKYILSRNKYKIMADVKKFFWLIPFRGYTRNKGV